MPYQITWENKDQVLILSMRVQASDIEKAIEIAHAKLSRLFTEDVISEWSIQTVSEL